MVQLQLCTAMRPGEVVRMRTIDIDTTGAIWLDRPGSDQGPHGAHRRLTVARTGRFPWDPSAEIVKTWFRLNVMEFLFSRAKPRWRFMPSGGPNGKAR